MSKLEVYFENVDEVSFNSKLLQERVEFLVRTEKKSIGNISVIFCTDNYLLTINEEYLGHTDYTDIITFDYTENGVLSGDLFISIERIKENADKFNTSFKNEIYRVIFHGLLHLAGYKDKSETEQEQMRMKEDFYLMGTDFDRESI